MADEKCLVDGLCHVNLAAIEPRSAPRGGIPALEITFDYRHSAWHLQIPGQAGRMDVQLEPQHLGSPQEIPASAFYLTQTV